MGYLSQYDYPNVGVMGFTRSMDYLHPTMNIRCCGLAPGAFHTPLWSEEKRSWMDNAEWLPLTQVVDGLIRCIEDENIKGGDILEVLIDKTRIMPLGGPLPSGPGISFTAHSN
jgi:NAD(P)-dependent dehydrogenase (short-subunit alcohol dehydrogenase family)